MLRGDIPVVRRGAEKLVTLSVEHGFALWLAQATVLLGWAMVEQGQGREGIALTREGLAAFCTTGADIGRPYFLSLLVESCIKTKCFEEGLTVLEEAQKLADQNENRSHDAELLRLKGELLLERDDSSVTDARNCFERAIEIARSKSARSQELLATTSLARLLAKQGNRIEARTILAEIYNWFTEGFDTADLKDAKALLDELSN
jgi:predicted ATPase